jgi:hypothetical protein
MTPLTAEKIAELEGLPAKWRADASGAEGYNYTAYEEGRIAEKRRCAAEIERLTAPFLSLAKRVAGAPVGEVAYICTDDAGAECHVYRREKFPAELIDTRVALVEIVGGEEG